MKDIKIIGITTTYNIAEKIPYVMPYYERMEIDKLIVFDNNSTDNTVELLSKYDFIEIRYYTTDSFDDNVILKLKNTIWKEYKNDYDWCIVCDFDEVLYSRRNFKEVLYEKSQQGKTYLSKIGLNILSREFPPINGKLIHENVKHGFIWDCDDDIFGTWGNKVILFDIKNTDIEYTEIGAHNCRISEETNKPFDDDISFFHLKLIDFNYVLNISKLYHERIKKHNIICYTNFIENLENIYSKSEKKSIDINYYIDTPGKILYPSLLLILEHINNFKEGKSKIDNIIKHINTNVFYGIGVIFYSQNNNIEYDKLYYYACSKGLSVFVGGEFDSDIDINQYMIGYSYLFKDNFKFKNPWVTMSNPKILKELSNPDLLKTLNENKLKDSTYFNTIEFKRFNTFIKEKRKTLGCYLIVKNEEKDIVKCLTNLSNVCDDILVVDTGSNDKTIELIKSFPNVKLDYFKWVDDFSEARNYAMSKMKSDYIFSIDADEILNDNLIKRINSLKQENFKGYNSINMFIELDSNRLYLGGRQIVKNNPENKWKYSIHEKLYYDESNDLLLENDEYIIHLPHKSTSHYNKYAEIYYNDVNKNTVLDSSNTNHYFYYMFFTLKDIDTYLAKKYLYNCYYVNNITSITENVAYMGLYDPGWISKDEFMLYSLIGGYNDPNMVIPFYNSLTDDISKLICLEWCYNKSLELKEEEMINLAYLSYQYGLFNDFIKYTNETVEKFTDSEIANNNLKFINETLSNLKNYKVVIDCTKGYECLPSTIHFMKQYFKEGYILSNDKDSLKRFEILNYKIINNINDIQNNKLLIINSNIQHNRIKLKDIMQNLAYNNEPKNENIYIINK